MLATSSDNSSSLSLALDARMAIKALHTLQQGGELNDALRKAVGDVTVSLKALDSGDPLFARLSQSSSIESYDQIQTLQEVKSDFGDQDVEATLDLVAKEDDPVQRMKGVEFAILFFTALERRARQKFNRSYGFGI